MNKHNGIYPLTSVVLDILYSLKIEPPKIEVHEVEDSNTEDNEPDFIWIKLTPELSMSEGEYMQIEKCDISVGKYWFRFGTRASDGCGGDATYGDECVDDNKQSALFIVSHYLSVLTGDDITQQVISDREEDRKSIVVMDESYALLGYPFNQADKNALPVEIPVFSRSEKSELFNASK